MYTIPQQRLMARELARSDGIVEKARDQLRLNYESFDTISADTLRHMMNKKPFRTMIRQEQQLLEKAARRGGLEAERAKAKSQALGRDDLKRIAQEAVQDLRKKVASAPKLYGVLMDYLVLLERLQEKEPSKKAFRPEDVR
jgi:hypothetical protein